MTQDDPSTKDQSRGIIHKMQQIILLVKQHADMVVQMMKMVMMEIKIRIITQWI